MKRWEQALRRWRKLADKGYGPRCNTPEQMAKVDERIRQAKAKYEELLAKEKKK